MVDAAPEQTNLWDVRKKALSTYSGGMKQRFGIAQALLANPKLIIVDEPTAGLDPAERNRFLNLLSSIGRDVTVILSTHIVDDVRELCPRMAIIANGEVLLEGAPAEALESLAGKIWSKVVATDDELRALETNFNVVSTHLIGGLHEVRVFADSQPGDGFRPSTPSLEDVYFLNLSRQAEELRQGDDHGHVLGILHLRAALPLQERLHLRLLRCLVRLQLPGCVASEKLRPIGNSNGKVLLNGPYANILQRYRLVSFFGIIIIAAIFGTSILRDFQRDTYQILFTKPISKFAYLGGRWAGSFVTTVFAFSGLLFGDLVGTFAPWADHTRIGPNHLSWYLQPFFPSW
jgi:hypothetical protein